MRSELSSVAKFFGHQLQLALRIGHDRKKTSGVKLNAAWLDLAVPSEVLINQ